MALRDDICQAIEEYTISAPQEWNSISAPGLKQALDAKDQVLLIDVREPAEYDDGHIPGAVNLPAGELPSRVKEMPRDRNVRIVTYCATGRRSAYATMFLRVYGYNEVRTLIHGIREWAASGYPTVK